MTLFELKKLSVKIKDLFLSSKYQKFLDESNEIHDNDIVTRYSEGACFMVSAALFDVFKHIGMKQYAIVEYCESENDYPAHHFLVGLTIKNKTYYLDSDNLYTKKEILLNIKNDISSKANLEIIPHPNTEKHIWEGDNWYDENILNNMIQDIKLFL